MCDDIGFCMRAHRPGFSNCGVFLKLRNGADEAAWQIQGKIESLMVQRVLII